MTTQDIANLSEQQLSNLMYSICRSGRVIIPNFYRVETVKNMFKNCEEFDINKLDMFQLQRDVEGAELDTIIYDACVELSSEETEY
jgi:hypothetical protein